MEKINIGDTVKINTEIVDFNDSSKKAKIKITGYAEDKVTITERYIWIDYENLQS